MDAFRRLLAACGPGAAELFSYTSSTAVRAALLAAGFHVAKGQGSAGRPETTIALTSAAVRGALSRRPELLGRDWLEKWERSGAKFPDGLSAGECLAFAAAIRAHPQFAA